MKKVKAISEKQPALQLEDMIAISAPHPPLDSDGMQRLRDDIQIHVHGTRGRHTTPRSEPPIRTRTPASNPTEASIASPPPDAQTDRPPPTQSRLHYAMTPRFDL